MRQKLNPLPIHANIVGIVDSLDAIRKAKRLPARAVDFLEWRADCLPLEIPLPRSPFPWIITARHPSEGGCGSLTSSARREMLSRHLHVAAALDIEVRSLLGMKDVIREAQGIGVQVIASFHNFQKTPTAAALKKTIRRAADAGADIVKIATVIQSPSDFAKLLDLFQSQTIPLSVMGMGALGMASRVLFASCGSILNYGWLDQPNVPGQWSAVELKRLLNRMGGGHQDIRI